MGMMARQNRESMWLLRPWSAHTDVWEVTWHRDHLPRGVLAIVGPRRCDPAFGPTVELRVLERGFEVFISSDEDDGRYVVPMDEDGLRRLVRELQRRAPVGGFLVTGAPRPVRDNEAAFLLEAMHVVLEGGD